MQQSDFEQFSKMMLATAEALDKDLTPQRIVIYFADLIDLDIRALEYAARRHRKSSVWFPKVAELRGLAQDWRPPALPGGNGAEQKLLESAESWEAKKQADRKRLREIIDSIGGLDAKYGTDFSKKSNFDKRLQELEKQKPLVVNQV